MLDKIRKIISKYNFDPIVEARIELIACDIYDMVYRKLFEKSESEYSNSGKMPDDMEIRADGLKNTLSIMIKDASIGEKLFIDSVDYNLSSPFVTYAHNLVKIHSKIVIKHVISGERNGWIVEKIGEVVED